jgi:predicted TIM-barrel fold metal-dependent hydrolase
MAKGHKGDEYRPARSPIPTQIVSNGEFFPPPQSERQKQLEAVINDMADARARKLGVSRRAFLKTSAGMATALVAANLVNGCRAAADGGFLVPIEATYDENCAREVFRADYFVMDVQTHHVDLDAPALQNPLIRLAFSCLRTGPERCTERGLALLSQMNFIKEIFIDSKTAVAIISGLPTRDRDSQALPVPSMAATRDLANELGCSERMLSQGVITPAIGPEAKTGTAIEDLEYQVKELGISAIKCYTGAGNPPRIPGWWLDDEKISYPMLAEAQRLDITNICVHKGIPLLGLVEKYLSTRDIPQVATDWPDLNFIVYHSGYFPPPGGHDVDEFVEMKKTIPEATNVYAELGSTFASAITRGVEHAGHVLGKLLKTFGPDHVCWGTDSIWWGTPQWQINMLKTFRIPARLVEQEGYPQLTNQIRAQIFGLNSARLYGVDPDAVRYVIRRSKLEKIAQEYRKNPDPSNRRYGPVDRRGVLRAARDSAYSGFGAMLKAK